ncbi:transmembrane protein 231-like [Photinus pyralis]|uniref:transmembrane protein 231-like n=1 Tax=Photinus pyralis TaxID=7054 RepID=UPI0012676DDB|nr:transmembrane protein 231-like [Photinus pyralis]
MVVLEIYSKCLPIKYKTYLISKATFFTLILRIISVIAPFVIVYNSRAFWLKQDSFYEQPSVHFRGEYIFGALTNVATSPIFCSNYPFLQKYAEFDRCPLVKVIEVTKNGDDKIDELQFSVTVDITELEIVSFYLILTLDYSLHYAP